MLMVFIACVKMSTDGELKLFIGDGMLIHATKVAGIK